MKQRGCRRRIVLNRMKVIVWFSLFALPLGWPQAAFQTPVTIDGLRFRVAAVVFDETAVGFAPAGMDAGSHVMLVELELLSGSRDPFKDLKIQVTHDKGIRTSPIIQIAEGMVKMLSTVTMTGKSSDYSPSEENIVWAFVIPRDASDIFLELADRETLDLSPYIK